MSAAVHRDGVQAAGDVQITDLTLITSTGKQIPLRQFLVELNIIEDMFATAIYGNVMITDSMGLIEQGPIIGEENLRIDCSTPGSEQKIAKTFRVYALSDRMMVNDDKTMGYILHFCSPEVFTDTLGKVYKSFNGRVDQIAEKVYRDYVQDSRDIVVNTKTNQLVPSALQTGMTVIAPAENNIMFTSPGWGPLKCLSWLASKTITQGLKTSDALFYESNKGFYFGSVKAAVEAQKKAGVLAGVFYYSPANVDVRPSSSVAVGGVQYRAPDIAKEYSQMTEFQVLDSFNTLKATQNGYYANQIITVDLTHKTYKTNNFDYVDRFKDFPHLDKNAPFTKAQVRNGNANTQVYFQQPGLYTGASNNLNERIADIKQNRLSLLTGLSNIRIQGTVPGRTDVECGTLVYFNMPSIGPKSAKDKAETYDRYMTGLYLVTAIRHKITLYKHMMTMEMVKDSLNSEIK